MRIFRLSYLSRSIERSPAVEKDVFATQKPKCDLGLERDEESISTPIRNIVRELDGAFEVLGKLDNET